jgi:hypothetical protein
MSVEYLSDEEILYMKWLQEQPNRLTVEEIKNHESIIKYAFLQGFSAGFHYKARIRAEEMLQK